MKFFLPSAAIVLALALCAESVPTQQDGQGAEVANKQTEQDRRLYSDDDPSAHEEQDDPYCSAPDVSYLGRCISTSLYHCGSFENTCQPYQTCSSSGPSIGTCVDPWTIDKCHTAASAGLTLITPTPPVTNPGLIHGPQSTQDHFTPLQCWSYCTTNFAAAKPTAFGLELNPNNGDTACWCYTGTVTAPEADYCDYTYGFFVGGPAAADYVRLYTIQ